MSKTYPKHLQSCPKHVQHMSKTCPRHSRSWVNTFPEICLKHVQTCPKHVQVAWCPIHVQWHLHYMSNTSPIHVQNMSNPKTCPIDVHLVSNASPSYVGMSSIRLTNTVQASTAHRCGYGNGPGRTVLVRHNGNSDWSRRPWVVSWTRYCSWQLVQVHCRHYSPQNDGGTVQSLACSSLLQGPNGADIWISMMGSNWVTTLPSHADRYLESLMGLKS